MTDCRHCRTALARPFLDLGYAPPSNAYLTEVDLSRPEVTYPLRLHLCPECRLVQTEDYARPDEIFRADYAYFSSTSSTFLAHATRFAAAATERFGLGPGSFVVEVASNDGYLLRNFTAAGIPCLGIEPTDATAAAAEAIGVPTERVFFGAAVGARLAREGKSADLVCGNNVYAHVPDIDDFTAGLAAVLKPEGVVTLEVPHLLRLMESAQFDTVYHEHFSYLSLAVIARIFAAHGLRVFDVEELPVHGGSIRVYACRADARHAQTPAVERVLAAEAAFGLETDAPYAALQGKAERIKDDLLSFLIGEKRAGRTVAAYGAAAKGNTLLNFAGVRPDLLPFVCDAAPAKQGLFLPGSHVPIRHPDALRAARPDHVLILPWNIAGEIRDNLSDLAAAGTRFVTAVPELTVT